MIISFLTKNFYINIIVVTLIFILDRFSKIYVINLSKVNFSSELYRSKYLNISLVWNEGIAFGLLSFNQSYIYNLLSLLIAIIIIFIFFMIIRNDNIKRYPLLMIFAGAIGNLYDRIVYKAVPDFIDFHVGEFHWFIFNVADIFISLGVFFMILLELIDNNKKNEKN
jgi:signal peptidase II|tara:strand:- start:639 stop:1139 length:501 start_codon:yes stop_codon:yes gene_type:complete